MTRYNAYRKDYPRLVACNFCGKTVEEALTIQSSALNARDAYICKPCVTKMSEKFEGKKDESMA